MISVIQLEKVWIQWEYNDLEMIEEEEEGYFTNMVHLMYNVFGKRIE